MLVRIDDVASAEFQQDFASDVTVRFLNCRRIGEADRLAVLADVNLVPTVYRKVFSSRAKFGRHDVADVVRNASLEAFAEASYLIPASAVDEGVKTVAEGALVNGDVYVLGKSIDNAVDLG